MPRMEAPDISSHMLDRIDRHAARARDAEQRISETLRWGRLYTAVMIAPVVEGARVASSPPALVVNSHSTATESTAPTRDEVDAMIEKAVTQVRNGIFAELRRSGVLKRGSGGDDVER